MLAKKSKFSKKDFILLKNKDIKKEINSLGIVYFLEKEIQKSTIIIPKKIFKKSSERNFLKRIFYRNLNQRNIALFIKNKFEKKDFVLELRKILNK